MKADFQEEEQHLKNVESKINNRINKLTKSINEKTKDINNISSTDYEDIRAKKELIAQRNDKIRQKELAESWIPEPYIGRIDYIDSTIGELKKAYIGMQIIDINSDKGDGLLVYSWKSDIGNVYYNISNSRAFKQGKENKGVEPILCRRISIKNAELKEVITVLNTQGAQVTDTVIDRFLLTLMNDKRREHKSTDIIATIQEKQNEIMRSDYNQSFILQGCAGSGKTMIMLHRLSVILFNDKGIKPENILIITPNSNFNMQIDELSERLELQKIKRLSVDEYYLFLIDKYTSTQSIKGNISNEYNINTQLLQEVYSVQYQDAFIEKYNSYWKMILQELYDLQVLELCKRVGAEVCNVDNYNKNDFWKLSSFISSARSIIAKNLKEKEKLKAQIEDLEKRISENQQVIAQIKNVCMANIAGIIEKLKNSIKKNKDNFLALQKDYKSTETSLVTAKLRQKSLPEEIMKIEEELQKTGLQPLTSYKAEYINTSNDETCKILREIFSDDVSKLRELEKMLHNIPSYNFVGKKKIKEDLGSHKAQFEAKAKNYVENAKTDLKNSLKALQAEQQSLEAEILSLEAQRKLAKAGLEQFSKMETILQSCFQLVSAEEYVGLSSLPYEISENAPDFIKEYDSWFNKLTKENGDLSINNQALAASKNKLLALQKIDVTFDDISIINKADELVNLLDIKNIHKVIYSASIDELYGRYNEKNDKDIYRHKLYLNLLLCYLYYGKSLLQFKLVNIDEAQDISVAEYRLLKNILNEKCVFNLYGDVNQLVYTYKGIVDWSELFNLIGGKVFELSDNYRNASPITKYINQEFGADITPIGIAGKPVKEMSLSVALNWITQEKNNNPDYRCALITAFPVTALPIQLKKILDRRAELYSYTINKDKIFVTDVELVKGLEFESVVVVTSNMTYNEKYISFTRALQNLVVVKEQP